MLHALDELETIAPIDQDALQPDTSFEEVSARLKNGFAALETKIDAVLKLIATTTQLKDEVKNAKDENARLKSERDDLKKAAVLLNQKNEKLTAELKTVSKRLDVAIEKVGKILEA